ncbi:DUF1329 domain-containing protein [Piscinibacter sp. XHJ-5]|uniref:DUF1329 domain-containing protein n=1 Tax=Piscinibacter sp. XHJ-5 TaxID=3037797 RepID=UPI00245296D5|nr:DUF1329 domain-containing protein [Piscinibacter sp. XHJ-5]
MKLHHIAVAALFAAGMVQNAVAQEGERLPWGALKAGNKDGTIPAWEGGLPASASPAGFKKDSGFWADPYAADKPLYSITAKNMEQYADKLSEATKELLKRNHGFRVDVYPSRRPVNYSQFFIENTKLNAAGRCKTIENGEAVTGCFGGTPFPVPKNGHEAMWNLILVNKGASSWTYGQGWYVDASGNKVMTAEVNNRNQNDYFNATLTAEQFYAKGGQYFMNNNTYTAPARITGEGNLQRKYINPVATPDKTWGYTPGQRRVRLSPDAAYDFPVATAAGAMLYDEIYAFSGKLDRFDWKLVGTKEMIIPYNAYKYLAGKAEDVMTRGAPNPDVMRWELHRVTVVEATLKPGARHVVAKRRFYFDEDNPDAVVVDAWDANGKLSRGTFNPCAWAYDKQAVIHGGTFYFDFGTGAYYNSSILGSYKGLFIATDTVDADAFYSPDGLARRTQR